MHVICIFDLCLEFLFKRHRMQRFVSRTYAYFVYGRREHIALVICWEWFDEVCFSLIWFTSIYLSLYQLIFNSFGIGLDWMLQIFCLLEVVWWSLVKLTFIDNKYHLIQNI